MSFDLVFITIITLLLIVALPVWPYSKRWGYYPSWGIGIFLLIAIFVFYVH